MALKAVPSEAEHFIDEPSRHAMERARTKRAGAGRQAPVPDLPAALIAEVPILHFVSVLQLVFHPPAPCLAFLILIVRRERRKFAGLRTIRRAPERVGTLSHIPTRRATRIYRSCMCADEQNFPERGTRIRSTTGAPARTAGESDRSCKLEEQVMRALTVLHRSTLIPNPSPERRGERAASPDVSSGFAIINRSF